MVEQIFAIFTEDFNGDGEINVQLRQYVSAANSTDADAAYYGYGSEVSLLGDINDCDSYIFLMDDPEKFQRDFHVLAKPDGSCPEELDFSVEDKVFLWKNCPVLSSFDLGTSTSTIFGQSITTDMQKILGELYIGRRCFYTETTCAHLTSCSELFERIREGIK